MPDVARCIVNESREVCVIFFYPRNIAIRASGQSLSGESDAPCQIPHPFDPMMRTPLRAAAFSSPVFLVTVYG